MTAVTLQTAFGLFTQTRPLLLIGCGRMGGALLDGWLERGLSAQAVTVIEPHDQSREQLQARVPGLSAFAAIDQLPKGLHPAVVLLAVKPQMMDGALANLRPYAQPGTAFISIAAGKSLAYFRDHLGPQAAVVRAMPNTPAAIGKGITAAIPNDAVSDTDKIVAEALLAAVGAFVWLDDEKHMDAVTAVSGSGPAYVFYLTECLTAAGVAAGLPPELSFTLATHTVSGAGALIAQSGDNPAALREAVTSPAGTTAAALDVLTSEVGLSPLLRKAVMAATKRSKELGQSS